MKAGSVLIVLGFASSAAFAQMQGSSSMSAQSPQARLEPKTVNGASYICGGIGLEEAAYLKDEARNHDLALQFATRRGDYIADVNVAIKDARGNEVLQANCDGPIMLVDLPRSGTYHIEADASGQMLNRTVNVVHGQGGKVASATLTWPQRIAEGPIGASTQSGASVTYGTGSSGNR